MIIQFCVESYMAYTFFQRLTEIDVKKPVRLGVFAGKGDNPGTYAYMYQGGSKVEPSKTIPEPVKKKKASGGNVTEWDSCVLAYREILKSLDFNVVGDATEDTPAETVDENIPF